MADTQAYLLLVALLLKTETTNPLLEIVNCTVETDAASKMCSLEWTLAA